MLVEGFIGALPFWQLSAPLAALLVIGPGDPECTSSFESFLRITAHGFLLSMTSPAYVPFSFHTPFPPVPCPAGSRFVSVIVLAFASKKQVGQLHELLCLLPEEPATLRE